jgi:adenylate kinase family enzyme
MISLSVSLSVSGHASREKMKMVPYALTVESIMYAILCTRPDVSYVLNMTSRYQKNLEEDHWTTVKNILKYLRSTKNLILVYDGEEHLIIMGYYDASF